MTMDTSTLGAGTAGPQDLMDSLAESVSGDELLGCASPVAPPFGDLKECPCCNSTNIKFGGNTGKCNNCGYFWFRG